MNYTNNEKVEVKIMKKCNQKCQRLANFHIFPKSGKEKDWK